MVVRRDPLPWYLDLEAWAIATLIALGLSVSFDVRADFPASTQSANPSSAAYQIQKFGGSQVGQIDTPQTSLSAACTTLTNNWNISACSQGQGCGYVTHTCAHTSATAYNWRAFMDGVGISSLNSYSASVTCPSGYTFNTSTALCQSNAPSCPANATNNAGTCSCNSGYVQNGSGTTATCVPNPCPAGSQSASGTYPGNDTRPDPGNAACDGTCETTFTGNIIGRYLLNGSYRYVWSGYWTRTGAQCVSGTQPSGSLGQIPANTCGPGQVLAAGAVNGQDICITQSTGQPVNPNVPPVTDPPATPSTTPKTTSSSTSSSTDPVTGNKTTVTTTLNNGGAGKPGGTTSTTTTVTDPDGNVISSDTVTVGADPMQPGSDFCKANPTNVACIKKDEDQCLLPENSGRLACMDAGEPVAEPDVATQNVGSSAITPVGVGGAGSCPAPIALPVGEWSFAGMCMVADGVRPVVIALAWILAGIIVIGSLRSGN